MPERPLISVALCTYNGQRFLPEQLDSLLSQDYPSLEVVAVDDASSDVRASFEEALRRCRGELIAPSDAPGLRGAGAPRGVVKRGTIPAGRRERRIEEVDDGSGTMAEEPPAAARRTGPHASRFL